MSNACLISTVCHTTAAGCSYIETVYIHSYNFVLEATHFNRCVYIIYTIPGFKKKYVDFHAFNFMTLTYCHKVTISYKLENLKDHSCSYIYALQYR